MTSIRSVMGLLSLLMLVGCAEYEGDPRFGEAVRNNIALHSVTPPGQGSTAPTALDGAPTKAAMDNYIYSYLHPQSLSSSLSVGMGAAAAGAGPTAAPVANPTGSY